MIFFSILIWRTNLTSTPSATDSKV